MKNILLILIAVIVGLGVYQMFLANNTTVSNTESDQVITDNSELDEPADMTDPMDNDTATGTDPAPEQQLSYCQDLKANISGSANFVITTDMTDGSTISSGDALSGCIYAPNGNYGNWAPFEGQVGSYEVLSGTGDVLGTGPLPVVPTDWITPAMAGDDIQYTTNLVFDATGYTSGSVVLRNENASGEPATEELIVISVNF